jgi:hypothetical protein
MALYPYDRLVDVLYEDVSNDEKASRTSVTHI